MNDPNPYEAPQNLAAHPEPILSPLSRNDVGCLFSFLGFFAGAYAVVRSLSDEACGMAGFAVLAGGIVWATYAGIIGLLVGFAFRLRSRRASSVHEVPSSSGFSDPEETRRQKAREEIVVIEELLRRAEACADLETIERLGVYKARLLRDQNL